MKSASAEGASAEVRAGQGPAALWDEDANEMPACSALVRGGTVLGIWVVRDGATHRYFET